VRAFSKCERCARKKLQFRFDTQGAVARLRARFLEKRQQKIPNSVRRSPVSSGRGFSLFFQCGSAKSRNLFFAFASVAQLVEHVLGKDEVIGSIPI
jgi:hypothetical protein